MIPDDSGSSERTLPELERRVAELEEQLLAARAQVDLAREEQHLHAERFWQTIDNAPIGMAIVGLDGGFVRVNRSLAAMLGYGSEELMRLRFQDITHPDDLQVDIDLVGQVIRGEIERYELSKRYIHRDGSLVAAVLYVSMVRDNRGEPVHFISQIVNVTEQQRAAEALRESLRESLLQRQVIESQRARLSELATPLIPIGREIMIMPLIGAIDTERTDQMLETLLAGIARARARVAILDITGALAVDEQVASGLLRAAQAVRLLGAQMVLSGVRAEVARAVVALGVDLSGIVTFSDLKAAISYAMKTI